MPLVSSANSFPDFMALFLSVCLYLCIYIYNLPKAVPFFIVLTSGSEIYFKNILGFPDINVF